MNVGNIKQRLLETARARGPMYTTKEIVHNCVPAWHPVAWKRDFFCESHTWTDIKLRAEKVVEMEIEVKGLQGKRLQGKGHSRKEDSD